jgi:dTMP kinase
MTSPTPEQARGYFIVFEGGEATGKTTQSQILAEYLGALWTREPGGTELGVKIRALCLDDDGGEAPTARTEMLLMAADRAQHVETVIEPALLAGRHVVCDRFSASSVAYQGAGRGMDEAFVRQADAMARGGVAPDLVVVIDVSNELRRERLAARGGSDRLEAAGDAFHARVAESFRQQARSEPGFVVVDGSGHVEQVAQRVLAEVAGRLDL